MLGVLLATYFQLNVPANLVHSFDMRDGSQGGRHWMDRKTLGNRASSHINEEDGGMKAFLKIGKVIKLLLHACFLCAES